MEEGNAELDLVPIMNLVTILIPFLLMSAQFVSLAVIDSSLPAISTEVVETTEEDTEEKLNLQLLITDKGFTLKGASKVLAEDDPENGPVIACTEEGCPTAESYNYEELTRRTALVKETWPDEENVIFVPTSQVAYEVIIHSMDAMRNNPEEKDEDGKAELLFPYVVMAGGTE